MRGTRIQRGTGIMADRADRLMMVVVMIMVEIQGRYE